MDLFSNLLAITVVSLLGAISPGPDFLIVVKNSLAGSRQAGFYTTFGVTTALIVHLTYTMVGLAVILQESTFFYYLIRYAGAGYLLYLGYKEFTGSFKKKDYALAHEHRHPISRKAAFQQGFLTDLLNPKCALFYISLFSQFIAPNTSAAMKTVYALINLSTGLLWFLFLSYLITKEGILKRVGPVQSYVERVMGVALLLIALKVIFFS